MMMREGLLSGNAKISDIDDLSWTGVSLVSVLGFINSDPQLTVILYLITVRS